MTWLATTSMLAHGWRRFLLLLVAGAVAGLSVAPFFLLPALFLSLPVLVWALDGAETIPGERPRLFGPSFVIGFAFGLGYFLVAIHWVGAAFLVDGGWLLFAMPVAVLALAAVLALFWGLGTRLAFVLWSHSPLRILALAAGLSLAEYARGHLFSGFPFDLAGYALTANETMMQAAALIGVYGLTPVVLFMSATPALIWPADERGWAQRLAPFFLALVVLVGQIGYGQWRLSETAPADVTGVKLRIVQPAVDQASKWLPGARQFITDQLISLSETKLTPDDPGLSGITHLIWPEAALPFYLDEEPGIFSRLARILPDDTLLLTGAPRRETLGSDQTNAYNSIFAINGDGEIVSTYDKVHLVPIGEALPFKQVFAALGLSQFVPGSDGWEPGQSRRLMSPAGTPAFQPLICYEIVFPGDLGPDIAQADFMLNLTNDAWFDHSIGPAQHFHHAQLRAVEEGIPLVRAANSGISAVVDAYGRVRTMAREGEVAILDSGLPGRIDGTLYQFLRPWPFIFLTGLFAALALLGRRRLRPGQSLE
ncbi:MAG: apolipoprotein N-acyltransferase [Hyphomicrobiaceae bacterium]|nr:apolipoprotein N-acyltransferase [Hyphomicrobiaceae bacterium]